MKTHRIIGIMSGTSMDGVDLAFCTFNETGNSHNFTLGVSETIPYPEIWIQKIKFLPQASALEYAETHTAYGRYLGGLALDFIERNQLNVDFVASHGHTIFHNPSKHYTSQIGEGAAIASVCRLSVVCDFRTGDVASGGQGAPLVPIGDQILFAQYEYCLNLGGFANISMQVNGKRIAFDISPVNIILNHIAGMAGRAFDEGGEMARSGQIHESLLKKLNNLNYYYEVPPKSLGREWIETEVLPLLSEYDLSPENAAATFCEHIAIQVASVTDNNSGKQMLITGGGAFNTYLIERIAAHTVTKLIIPDDGTVNYKEALVFAFLGLLRMQNKPNCLASVTGASHDVSGGAVYLP